MLVWTKAYRPFILGNPHTPISCELPALGPVELGKGYTGYLIVAPNGKTFVAEATSGGFVGTSLESVRSDVADSDQATMDKQVADAIEMAKDAARVQPEQFWRLLRCEAPGP